MVLEFQQLGQLVLTQHRHPAGHILPQHKIEKSLKFLIRILGDQKFAAVFGPLLPAERFHLEADVGEHVIEIALLGVNHFSQLVQLLNSKSSFFQILKQGTAGAGVAPEFPEFVLILKELGKFSIEPLDEFLRADQVPLAIHEDGGGDVPDEQLLAVREGDLEPWRFFANAGKLLAVWTKLRLAFAGLLPADLTDFWRTNAGTLTTVFTGFGLFSFGLAIPLWIIEMRVGFDEIVHREVILPLVKPGAASDDLLELNDGTNRTQ